MNPAPGCTVAPFNTSFLLIQLNPNCIIKLSNDSEIVFREKLWSIFCNLAVTM